MNDLLNPAQRVSLQVSLRLFEQSLRHAESVLNNPLEVNGILFRQRFAISEAKRTLISTKISAALDQIRVMRELFALDAEEENLARQVASELSVSWENLMDVRAKKLRGYGKIHPELPTVLDPRIKSLSAIALELAALFGEDEAES